MLKKLQALLAGRQLRQTTALLAEREQALRQAHRALDRFFTLSLDLFCVASFDGYFKRLNPAWRQTLGWSDEELCARPFLDFVHPDDRESTSREAGKLAEGAVTVQFENRYRCQDGSYRWLEWMAVPVPEELQIYAMARDVTGRKEAEAKLATLNRELEAFSYSVSHDLRAPLRSIDGFSQVLLEDYSDKLDQEGKDSLQRVRMAAARMSALIDALLVLSRVSRTELRAERVDLSAMAHAIAIELRLAEPARQVEVVVQAGMVIEGDARLLRAALENLLANAWKFTRAKEAARIEFGCYYANEPRAARGGGAPQASGEERGEGPPRLRNEPRAARGGGAPQASGEERGEGPPRLRNEPRAARGGGAGRGAPATKR